MASRWATGMTILAASTALSACAALGNLFGPGVPAEWSGLVGEVRVFERQIGFDATDNFLRFSQERRSYGFCGYAPPLMLPYSYEDPAIRWVDASSLEECS